MHRNLTLPLLALSAATLIGCADAVTFSESERATGRIALGEGEHEIAARIFANQVRRAPRDYKAHFHLGQAQWAAGRRPEAVRSYTTALDVMPLTLAGQADDEYRFLIIDELAGALAAVDADGTRLAQVERGSKGDKYRKLLVALTHAKAGRPDAAIGSFTEAVRLDRMDADEGEQDARIAKAFGLYYESLQQPDAAEAALRLAYSIDPRDEETAAALRRLDVIPGPAILSKTQLAKPGVPLGPLPELKLNRVDGEADPAPPEPDYLTDVAGLN